MSRKYVLRIIAASLWVLFVIPEFAISGGKPHQQMLYEVGFTSFVFNDASRPTEGFPDGRPIAVSIWYPAESDSIDGAGPAWYPMDPFYGVPAVLPSIFFESHGFHKAYAEPTPADGPFQLVVFSPGWGGPAYGYTNIGPSLASQGIVFAAVTHFGDGTTGFVHDLEPFDHLGTALFNRPKDISAALDVLLDRNADPDDLLSETMDAYNVVAAGHSLGGYAAMALAGGDDEVCDLAYDPLGRPIEEAQCGPNFTDPRIRSIIPLDGSNQVLWFDELARIHVPVMAMGQEWDALDSQGVGSWQARQHAAFSGHPSYRIDVNHANHDSFSAFCAFSGYGCATDAETHRLVNKYMLAFLTGQQKILTPGHAINSEPNIEFFVTEKRSHRSIVANETGFNGQDEPGMFVYFKHQAGKKTAKAAKDPMNQPAVAHFGD
jgi:predicted dienelactone hydrolase